MIGLCDICFDELFSASPNNVPGECMMPMCSRLTEEDKHHKYLIILAALFIQKLKLTVIFFSPPLQGSSVKGSFLIRLYYTHYLKPAP